MNTKHNKMWQKFRNIKNNNLSKESAFKFEKGWRILKKMRLRKELSKHVKVIGL